MTLTVKAVFYPILEFHAMAWEAVHAEKQRLDRAEEARVASERGAEALRVAGAKALAMACLTAAGAAFGVFMLLALYLLASKAENDLREINDSIRELKGMGGATGTAVQVE